MLCCSHKIGRLSVEGIKLVLEELHNMGLLEWKTADKQAFLVYFLNPHEIAELIMKWVKY